MKSVRTSYVKEFGEEQAKALENAAQEHKNGVNDKTGSDPFKWAVLIAIGFQCVEEERFRNYHGIDVPLEAFKKWAKLHGELASHDGDFDYLAMAAGAYSEIGFVIGDNHRFLRACKKLGIVHRDGK